MSKHRTWIWVLVAVAVAASPAGADKPAGELEGAWSVVAVTMNGLKAAEDTATRITVIVKGNTITVKPGLSVDNNGKLVPGNAEGDKATFTLDPARTPAHIDLTFGAGKDALLVKGIYAVEKGELKICYSPKARPKDFANAADSGQTLFVARREKP